MKTFQEFLNESELLKTDELSEFEKETKGKAIPAKYAIMFNDQTINDKMTVWYDMINDMFNIEPKGVYFKSSNSFKTKYPHQAWTVINFILKEKELGIKLIRELILIIEKDNNFKWNSPQQKQYLIKRIKGDTELQELLTKEDAKVDEKKLFTILGITDRDITSYEFDI